MSASRVRRLVGTVLSTSASNLARKCGHEGQTVLREAISVHACGSQISGHGAASPWAARFFASAVGRSPSAGLGGNGMPVRALLEVPSSCRQFFRDGQLRAYSSAFRSQRGRVDIGARARQNQARRLWTIVISGTLVAGFIIVVLNTFQENMMFYITPSQALEKYYIDPSKNKFRLGGLVLEGSVHHSTSGTEMEFIVTDLANEILVRYRGALPDLFREGHSVVAEGYLRPLDSYPGRLQAANDPSADLAEKAKEAGCYFTAVEVLAKHDEKYMPKEVAAAIEKNKAAQEEKQLALAGALAQTTALQESAPPPSAGGKRKGVSQTPVVVQGYEIR
ncbi:unnamed protein product [Calypogeia fissa]